jgi:pyruvate/2-oxoglutarate dehydrogenase complex dihydrolipoamide dehydrogenase (E3) component
MRCFSFFSDGMTMGHFFLSLNPETVRERYFGRMLPEVKKQKILVAGGGIGGMQAALTAAKNGHDVILCEKTSRLGGNILCEENVPFKKHMVQYIELQRRLISRTQIDLRLNIEVTPEYAKAQNVDVIIASIGARPTVPKISGIDGANCMSAEEAYYDPDKSGTSVTIIGAGFVGTELAIYLNGLGKKVTVIELLDSISTGGNILHGKAIMVELNACGIEVNFNIEALRIDAAGLLCRTPDGEKHIACDTVVYAVGQKPLFEQADALRGSAPQFYALGDCVTPATISAANASAATIAREVGRL